MTKRLLPMAVMAAFLMGALSVATPAAAQRANARQSGPPNAVQGFSTNRDKPVQIEAAQLEVRDKDKVAMFSGDVQVVQGDTRLRCKSLLVYYDNDAKGAPAKGTNSSTFNAPGEQKIRKLEARGGVVVTQAEQVATGDTATFDMRANSVTLAGNVVVTQGPNVLRGDKLHVDLTTGVSRVESGRNGEGRVQGLFLPGSGGPAPAPAARPRTEQAPARPHPPGAPLQLNGN